MSSKKSAVTIGFVPAELAASVAFPVPRTLLSTRSEPLSRRAVQACPAVNTFEGRAIEILAPFSLRLRCLPGTKGAYDFHIVESGTVPDAKVVERHVGFMSRQFWRTPDSPVIQINLPHFFVCDETCYLTQAPAWASSRRAQVPGMLISGRFPTNIWPRALNFAFEWTERDQDFIMRRGEALCYFIVETDRPDTPIRLVQAMLTSELQDYRKQIEDVVAYTSGAFNLFDEAKKVRPAKLLREVGET